MHNTFFRQLWILACLSVAQFVVAQHPNNNLPHQLTPSEQREMPAYRQQIQNNAASRLVQQPPTSAVRTPAEWEETQGLIVSWTSYQQILREIVRHAREECTVYIVTTNPTSVQSYLTAGGVSLDNIVFLNHSFNSIWVRDYGPWSVYTNDVDSLSIVDWTYNRPRPLDDAVPVHVANDLDLPLYEMTAAPYELVHTGGNYMVDGLGTAFSSELILDENPSLSEAQIDSRMAQFMGINRYIKMETLPYDEIHHIDMHLKLLDEETLLVGQYPSGVADGPQIEENLNYILNNFLTPFGNPYHVVRVPMPPDASGDYPDTGGDYRTYANAIFINKTLLVPTYQEQYDTTGLRILQEQLPGYNVVGINCNSIISALGALHCITKLVHTADPLLIAHPRLRDTPLVADRNVIARIQHRSGIASATLYYTTSLTDPPAPYAIPMTLSDPDNNVWTATIPAQAAGAVVQYYIEAQANSGKTQVRPITAPEGSYTYKVLETATAPLTAQIKLQLSGAYNNATQTMHTTLRNHNLLPHAQPYNTAPWNYNGNESAYSLSSEVVDWVLVELRDALNPSNIVARKAALLYRDGTLHHADGTTLSFGTAINSGNYYIAIKHRNHLPIMSAEPVSLPNSTPYDFGASPNNTWGNEAQLQNVATATWALPPADIAQNGVISVADFNQYTTQSNSTTNGYYSADLDLNGIVDTLDFELYRQSASRLALPILR
jgi:agmatine deiminase